MGSISGERRPRIDGDFRQLVAQSRGDATKGTWTLRLENRVEGRTCEVVHTSCYVASLGRKQEVGRSNGESQLHHSMT